MEVMELPGDYRWLERVHSRPRRQRIIQVALLMAREGVSTAMEMDRLTGMAKRSVHDVLDSMLNLTLIESRSLRASGRWQVRVVTLTEYGKGLCQALGTAPVESDWEKIVRLHNGHKQPRHAALVLIAAYQARLRGWKAEVMPFDPQETPWFQPDLKVVDPDGWIYYCEVESRTRVRPRKWARMRQVNLIAPTPVVRQRLAERLRQIGIPGRATDLRTLAQQAKAGDLSRFWLEKW